MSQISFEIGVESSFMRLFWSKIVIIFNQNRHNNTNSDIEFESEFEYDQKFIEFDQNGQRRLDFYWFRHFRLNNWHHHDHFQSFNQKMIESRSKLIYFNQNYTKIAIINRILSLISKSDQNRLAISASLESESSRIQF